MKPAYYKSSDFGFNRKRINRAALDVVKGLQQAGFDGYLVGGCVRDLLFGKEPKDFDVTTNASPEEAHKIFRRSRIIGRRFRLVHVRFGREVIEVATYRANPNQPKADQQKGKKWWQWKKNKDTASGRILDDNVYGTLEEDASRRDFTVNALYYDPFKEQVVDFLGGVEDVQGNHLKMIGDPNARFVEDPVRMLRVIRFQAKLGIEPEARLITAIQAHKSLISDVPAARLFDEVLKLFHHAHGVNSWRGLRDSGLDAFLFPEVYKVIEDSTPLQRLIELALVNTDRRIQQNKPVIPAFLFAVLLWRPFCDNMAALQSQISNYGELVWQAGDRVFAEQCAHVAIPRRVSAATIEVWLMQGNLERRRPKSILSLMANRRFRAGYDFLLLRAKIGEVEQGLVDWWTDMQETNDTGRLDMIDQLHPGDARSPNARKRSPRKRRRSRSAKKV